MHGGEGTERESLRLARQREREGQEHLLRRRDRRRLLSKRSILPQRLLRRAQPLERALRSLLDLGEAAARLH